MKQLKMTITHAGALDPTTHISSPLMQFPLHLMERVRLRKGPVLSKAKDQVTIGVVDLGPWKAHLKSNMR